MLTKKKRTVVRRTRLPALMILVALIVGSIVVPHIAWAGPASGNVSEVQDSVNAGPVEGKQTWNQTDDRYALTVNVLSGSTWSAGTCADSLFDWLTSGGHKDAAIARSCDWHFDLATGLHYDTVSTRSLIGSQKLGTCVGADDHTTASASLCTDHSSADQTVVGNINGTVPQTCARTWLIEWGGYGPTEHAGGDTDDCYS